MINWWSSTLLTANKNENSEIKNNIYIQIGILITFIIGFLLLGLLFNYLISTFTN
jgi:hypothetical protein